MNKQFYSLVYKTEIHTHKKACAKMFIVALSKIAKSGNKPTAHRIVNG
jgi:hypothetical protein